MLEQEECRAPARDRTGGRDADTRSRSPRALDELDARARRVGRVSTARSKSCTSRSSSAAAARGRRSISTVDRARSRPTRCSSSSRTSAASPLLTAAQEVELAKRIERGDHAAKQADGRGQPAPRRLDREELPQPGPAVPRPDPGGNDRARARGGEVRLPQGLQVLDLRDVVDPPGRRARARRQGAHDPHAGARRREAEQDRPHGAQAARASSAASRRPRRSPPSSRSTPTRSSRSGAAHRRRSRSRSRSATRRRSEFGHFLADVSAARPTRRPTR